jgi:hypothetical protein
MSKLSEQVQNQIRTSEKVVASARTHSKKIAKALAERFATTQGADTKATPKAVTAVVAALADVLSHATDELRARELAYTAEQADDGPVRAARDASVQDALGLMTRLRSTVEDALGRTKLSTYGLQGDTPRAPRRLLHHIQNVSQLLKQSPATVTTPFGSSFSTESASAVLDAKHRELGKHIKDDDREARELEDALAERDRAMAAWSDAYQAVASALEGMYRLAGWKELAERVRPTQRAARGEEVGGEGTEEGEDVPEDDEEEDGEPEEGEDEASEGDASTEKGKGKDATKGSG